MMMQKFAKAIAAAVFALVVTGAAVQDKEVTADEWVAVSAAWAGVAAVYQVRNKEEV